MSQKQRTTFALKNFRGLDKENKLLKVQSYRASDGYNFIIDSETLKTRPSFTLAHNPNFFLEEGDYLVDWHLFGHIYVYVTKKHIYLVDGNIVFNEKTNQVGNPFIRSSFSNDFNFEGFKPLFQEEKDCLFIFCLNEIYVVSTIKNEDKTIAYYVLYNLREKPGNPFTNTIQTYYEEKYEELPEPYIPTIILGGNAFEDVNLLSNKSRYQLFANIPTTTMGVTTYTLPTYYDQNKHGVFSLSDINVSFYGGRYDGNEAFPVFLGVFNEDFFGNLSSFGTALNPENPIIIENTFFPVKPFEYTDHNPEQIVFERLYLTKKTFFEFRTKTPGSPTVFEYIMDYIKSNSDNISNWTDENGVLLFTLPVQNEVILRDNQDRDVKSQSVRRKNFAIFVQIKKFEEEYSLKNENIQVATQTTTNLSLDYLAYPAFTSPDPAAENTFVLNNNEPILVAGDVQNEFLKMARAKIAENQLPLDDNDKVGVRAKLYTVAFKTTTSQISMPTTQQTNELDFENIEEFYYTPQTSYPIFYPAYPGFNNPNNYSIKDLGDLSKTAGVSPFTFQEGTPERNQLISRILTFLNSNDLGGFNLSLGYGIFKARMFKQSIYKFPLSTPEGELLYGISQATSVIVKVAIQTGVFPEETRYSFTFSAIYEEDPVPVKDNLYEVNLKEDKAFIELKVKDFFYDYKNEPSIELLIAFEQNTDYNIIAQSRFGATFGSENRLFLAGNSEFPNVDRFNVSNDLLGLETKNQSYELSYFPSKNFRVLGGKGAINGYVVATDSQLYITKENYPNDSKLFIRQRNLSEQGQVFYNEFKTNITKSPLNNRCLIRFYNDILVLAKDGLFGIEISQNVLTDERLVKLRSGFINKDLVEAIANYDNSKIFVVENDIYMYIVIGERLYLADSRYISQNPNSAAENVSYEIIEWKNNANYITANVVDDIVYFIQENNNLIYSLQEFNSDDFAKKGENDIIRIDFQNNDIYKVFNLSNQTYPDVFVSPSSYVLKFLNMGNSHAYIQKAIVNADYTVSGNTVTIINLSSFANIQNESKLYWYTSNTNTFTEFTVLNLTATTFQFDNTVSLSRAQIFQRVTDSDLYIKDLYINGGNNFITLTNTKPDGVNAISSTTLSIIEQSMNVRNNIFFSDEVLLRSILVIKRTPINLQWVSAITDFGVAQMEKTSFRVNLYATKKEETNTVTFGYRTMRRMSGLSSPIDLSNNFDFNEVDYNQFALATFDTVAISLPMKENNFLYIQFTLNGVGKIEMNAIEVIYKANRMLKSIG
jgi:hypothetical protein